MAQVKSARFTKEQQDAIEDMVERGKADNESEAHRMFVNAGMRDWGYRGGETSDTLLKRSLENVSYLFSVAGIVGLAFTAFYPIEARIPSFAVLSLGVGLYMLSQSVAQHEPDITRRLRAVFGGGSA